MRESRRWLRPAAGVVILGVALWRFGSDTVVHALGGIDGSALAAAAALAALTTLCGAWRWVLVARGLGTGLSLRSAVAESYRSQFLNVTLPGGVVGDVRRGVRHGRSAGDVGRGLRAVVWERTAGQVVLGALAVGALLLLPWPFREGAAAPVGSSPGAVAAVVVTAVVVVVSVPVATRSRGRTGRLLRAAAADVRAGVLGSSTWPGVVVASVLVVAGHVATFVVAARSAGVTASPLHLVPLALLVLVAMAVPLNVAGWGPREGAAAWLFGAAGLGTTAGMGTAVVYGVLVLVASLPGAALLVVSHRTVQGDGSLGRSAATVENDVAEDVAVDVEVDVKEGAARG